MKTIGINHWAKPLLLALALTTGVSAAQTFDESVTAYAKNDYKTAFWGFKRLAEQGDAKAQTMLGVMYDKGVGVPKDDRQAVAWYRKAAEQDLAKAQFNLGVMYAVGEGVPKDDRQALAWYRKAAEQGFDAAQFNLGVMYSNGTGIPKDEGLAYFWWLLSSAQGHENAKKYRDDIEKQLTPNQRASAQAAARVWKAKPTSAL